MLSLKLLLREDEEDVIGDGGVIIEEEFGVADDDDNIDLSLSRSTRSLLYTSGVSTECNCCLCC